MSFHKEGKQFALNYTRYEWGVLVSLAGGDEKKFRFWLNAQLHNLCDRVIHENPFIECPECDKVKMGFYIPPHLEAKFELLTERYKTGKANIVDKLIINPTLSEKHFKIYGY